MFKKIKKKLGIKQKGSEKKLATPSVSSPAQPVEKSAGKPKKIRKGLKKSKTARKPGIAKTGKQKKNTKVLPGVVDPDASIEANRYENPVASRRLILDTIGKKGTMTMTALFRELDVQPDQEEGVSRRLGAMVRDGQLVRNRRGGFLPVDEKHLIKGHVIAHPDGFGFLVPDEGGDDLFLSGKQMRTLLHGDRAVVTVAGIDRRGRREGSVISVIERANTTLVGRLFCDDGVAYVVADNKRITQDIFIPAESLAGAETGQIVKIDIVKQPTFRRQPIGRIIDIIGDHMAPGMEIEIAIHSHGLPAEFSTDVVDEAQLLGDSVKAADKKSRVDLRHVPLLTIDGADARDFDDAVYCEPRGEAAEKGWRLLVAIADVAHYVPTDSALDQSAYERATSVYFPGRVLPMLPEEISNGLCSINPDVDRLCMVCEMMVNRQGEIDSYQFFEAVMRSHARLTYKQVAGALENEKPESDKLAAVFPQLSNLYAMYKKLDLARKKRGSIDFETTETVIEFTSDQRINHIHPSERNDAHKIIEECMIAANVCAAKYIAKSKLPSLYRVHEEPTDEKLEDLRGFLRDLGLSLGEPQRKITPKDYARLSEEIKDRDDMNVIQTLMLRSMKQAVYKAENLGHFGLALTHYAHFTSPIRRYPDLIVHRAIKHIVHKRAYRDYLYPMDHMVKMGEHCSANERRANEASRDAETALKCEYMLDKIGQEYAGHISSVLAFGIFVELDDEYVEGLVHITCLPKDFYEFDPTTHLLSGENHGRTFGLNDKVRVRVVRVDMDERKIDFELTLDS